MPDIKENVARVLENIRGAERAAGRPPGRVLLVAASKTNGAERVREAVAAGVGAVGENRVQEMLQKLPQGAYEGVPLHFIGHLQKNKLKNVVGVCSLIESVDSGELLRLIDARAGALGIVQDILLEVNIAGESTKSGFPAGGLPAALDAAAAMDSVRIRGLMAIPPIFGKENSNRRYFSSMYKLFIDIAGKKYDNVPMDILSMGMSGDYMDAIAEGSTAVRVGSAIFGERQYARP